VVLSSYTLLFHGANIESSGDIRNCLQADGTHKTNMHDYPTLIVGDQMNIALYLSILKYITTSTYHLFFNFSVSDYARVFHPLAICKSTNEDTVMFKFIDNSFEFIFIRVLLHYND
jgi:hypothetical protein